MALELPYALVDVFAENALEGNMLAIFTDARGLTTEQMQALARETNLAETTFILPAEPEHEREHGVRVRIFTTQEEFRFAGHPTLGTAAWLHLNHPVLKGAETVTLDLNVGPIPVRFEPAAQGSAGVFGTMQQNAPVFGATYTAGEVASLLGVGEDALDPAHPIQIVSTGMAFCIVPFRSVAALERLSVHQAEAQPWLDRVGAKFFYCIAPAEAPGVDFRARMQFYNGEDPATGSAAGCAAAWLVRHGLLASEVQAVIEQGIAIRRPSRLYVRASFAGGEITSVYVGGRTIPVAKGSFLLP